MRQTPVPWRWVGEVLPVRITETELYIYDRQIHELARHPLLTAPSGRKQTAPEHRPPKYHNQQLEQLRERFAELGTIASRFLEGLLDKQRPREFIPGWDTLWATRGSFPTGCPANRPAYRQALSSRRISSSFAKLRALSRCSVAISP
ncbi:MAG TPA: hypothetical protein VMP01_04595 [Pirellulaceae bacterium]|nr:hypothetical protein [Pirellulaceae bacterium]